MSFRPFAASTAIALATALPAAAQDAEAPAPAPEQQAPAEAAPAEGEAAVPQGETPAEGEAGERPGEVYVRDVYTDWQLRCERAAEGEDPCQLYQLLRDGQGNSVAEFALFKVPDDEAAAAGATIITPLMTLLTEPLRLSVDGGDARALQLQWCTEIGCVVQFGLSEAEIQAFRRGNTGRLTLVPVVAADRAETLSISLAGFTAGFAALQEAGAVVAE